MSNRPLILSLLFGYLGYNIATTELTRAQSKVNDSTSTAIKLNMPTNRLKQLEYRIQNGMLIEITGVDTAVDNTTYSDSVNMPTYSPMGSDWWPEDNLKNLTKRGLPVVLMLSAPECPGCIKMKPMFEIYASNHPGQAIYATADIHYNLLNKQLTNMFGGNTPTFVVINSDREIGKLNTNPYPMPYKGFEQGIDSLLSKSKE